MRFQKEKNTLYAMNKSTQEPPLSSQTVIGVIFSSDEKVLLVKRRDVPVWVLPGGGIEDNEAVEDAVVREVLEETGFHVKVLKKIGKYLPINSLARHTHLFACAIVKGNPTIGLETKEVEFFPVKKLPKLIPPPHDEWITDALLNPKEPIVKSLTRVNYRTLFFNLFKHPILVIRFLLTKIGLTINT